MISKKIIMVITGILILVIITCILSLLNDERDSIFMPGRQVPGQEMLSLSCRSCGDLQLNRQDNDSIYASGSGALRPEMIEFNIAGMKVIYTFELQCCLVSQVNRNLIHYYHEKEIEVCERTYSCALFLARIIFKKLNPACRVPFDQIQVLNCNMTDPEADYTMISKELQHYKYKELQRAMDEMLTEFLIQNPRRISKTVTVVEIIKWLQEKKQQIIDFKNIQS